MPKIKIDQFGKELEAKPGENILEVLQREGIDINAYCGGFGYCGKCLIKILKGNVAQPTAQEIKHLKEKISQGYRLACQAQIIEDIEIDIHDSITQKVEVLAESGEAILEELPVKKNQYSTQKTIIKSIFIP
jgi:ferredoxin